MARFVLTDDCFKTPQGPSKGLMIEMTDIPSYCGGKVVTDVRFKCMNDWVTRTSIAKVAANLTTFDKLLFTIKNPSYIMRRVFMSISSERNQQTHTLNVAGDKYLVVLPKPWRGRIPTLPTAKDGAALQRIVRNAFNYSTEDRGELIYKVTAEWGSIPGSLKTITNNSIAPIGFLKPNSICTGSDDMNNTTPIFRLFLHHNHEGLPWYCPVNRRYSITFRLGCMLQAMHRYHWRLQTALVFDHWDLAHPSPAVFYRTISELHSRQIKGWTSIMVRGKRLYYNVFMHNGTNRGHGYHLTSGMAISTKGPITFEKVVL